MFPLLSFLSRRCSPALIMLLAAGVLAACSLPLPGAPTPPAPSAAPSPEPTAQPRATATPLSSQELEPAIINPAPLTTISGEFSYSNDFIFTYYVQHAVALVDMYGFVTRDWEWELPVESQVLGFLDVDEQEQRGIYRLSLPVQPLGTLVDVDNDEQRDSGVQIFAVAFAPNLTGGPFAEGNDLSRGWPSYLASTINDTENNDEVIGGKLLIWSPDDQQQFPTGFGEDELLFTADDPVGPVQPGYTVVDLDQRPFAFSQAEDQSLPLYEPADVAIKDLSDLSYSEAFRELFERVRREYAFSGIAGKEPAWDELYNQLAPRVAEAEQQRDARSFYLALRDFTMAFRDGHVSLSGGRYEVELIRQQIAGGYGMAIRELDDKRVIVTYVLENGPADRAGIVVGAELTAFNGQPITAALDAVQPLTGPFSTDFGLRLDQQRFLLRAPLGSSATLTFTNPGQAATTTTLTAVAEQESLAVTSLFRGSDPTALPVEFRLLDSGIGYIKINSYYDDLNLMLRLFERALQTFEQFEVEGLIIDLRQNGGGAPISLADFLAEEEIDLGQREYYSEKTGRFEPDGPPRKVEPTERTYRFDQMALLVSPACASACDIGAYGFSQLPNMIVVGQYPTAGIYAEVARGQYLLPAGFTLQVPTGRTVLPDGSIFLEGKGVPPTLRVPITEENVLSDEDVVLQAAEAALLDR